MTKVHRRRGDLRRGGDSLTLAARHGILEALCIRLLQTLIVTDTSTTKARSIAQSQGRELAAPSRAVSVSLCVRCCILDSTHATASSRALTASFSFTSVRSSFVAKASPARRTNDTAPLAGHSSSLLASSSVSCSAALRSRSHLSARVCCYTPVLSFLFPPRLSRRLVWLLACSSALRGYFSAAP